MSPQADVYRSLRRQHPTLPAGFAWEQAQDQVVLDQRVETIGFYWRPCGERQFAVWREHGHSLHARTEVDDTGWDMWGTNEIGRFQAQWAPGAIRRIQTFGHADWFVPAWPDYAHQCYRRACAFGRAWIYVSMTVSTGRAGVDLGFAVLSGLESDDLTYNMTGIAFYLADEAMKEADLKLKQLCASR